MVIEDNFSREAIFSDYPWMKPKTKSEHPYLVIGDDLDALLSAALWNTVFQEDWKIIGVYHQYKDIYCDPGYSSHLENSIWLDLDIAQENIRSIGHHIIRLKGSDRHPSSGKGFNLNERRGTYVRNFREKYPLGTIHFLMYLFQRAIPRKKYAPELISLADSTWINGQGHRFRENVGNWLDNCIPEKSLQHVFELFDTRKFEDRMKDLHEYLGSQGIPRSKGQVSSRVLGLKGYQCQFDPGEFDEITKRFKLIEEITGWSCPEVMTLGKTPSHEGMRKTGNIPNVIDGIHGSLDTFLCREDVFSYVIPNRGRINYTCGIKI